MPEDASETAELLRRWHDGDRQALDALLARDLEWIRGRVHARLGSALRARAETVDLVQDVIVEFLRYGPPFVVSSRRQLRALLARIAENVIRGQHDRFSAQRRDVCRERPLPRDSVLRVGGAWPAVPTPSQEAERAEREGWVRLALALIDPEDREVLLLRAWEELPFREIGERLGLAPDAARMRFHRALARLAGCIHDVRSGSLERFLGEAGLDDPDGDGPEKDGQTDVS